MNNLFHLLLLDSSHPGINTNTDGSDGNAWCGMNIMKRHASMLNCSIYTHHLFPSNCERTQVHLLTSLESCANETE